MHAYKYSEDSSLSVFIFTLYLEWHFLSQQPLTSTIKSMKFLGLCIDVTLFLQKSHVHLLLSKCYTLNAHCVKVKAIFCNITYLQDIQETGYSKRKKPFYASGIDWIVKSGQFIPKWSQNKSKLAKR